MTSYVFPGQGSQEKGMGSDLFSQFSDLEQQASEILGYSVKQLCIDAPASKLFQTQYTQPCLFFVSVLHYLKQREQSPESPNYMAGHSLGEYTALYAAGTFDLSTGLRIVQERGRLMSKAKNGAMAAVLGKSGEQVRDILEGLGISSIDVANYNSSTQVVISGPADDIHRIAADVERHADTRYIPLPVSAAFHSRYMQEASEKFAAFIEPLAFSTPNIPVIANVTARPYRKDSVADIKATLAKQIVSPVRWTETVRYLMGKQENRFIELGPGTVLTKLIEQIQREEAPLIVNDSQPVGAETSSTPRDRIQRQAQPHPHLMQKDAVQPAQKVGKPITPRVASDPISAVSRSVTTLQQPIVSQQNNRKISAEMLGSEDFRDDYGITYSYLAGSMYKGISSPDMVITLGKAGLMGFLGTGGMRFDEVAKGIATIQGALSNGEAYGINLLNNIDQPELEEALVKLYLERGVRVIEASAFMHITPALVWFRLRGAKQLPSGEVHAPNYIIAKISRPEIAEQFMSPAPAKIVHALKQRGLLTEEEASCAQRIPISHDICVESDSGGHTDKGVAHTLLPSVQITRDQSMKKFKYSKPIRVGSAGGIGTPEAAAATFMLGADFILTGSINQCTAEAGTSNQVKDLLQAAEVTDTAYAPSGDMFELGAQIQVLKKGLFFPARANKLFDLYKQFRSIEELDDRTKQQIQTKFFKRSFDEVWSETAAYYRKNSPNELVKAEHNPKTKMAMIFKWYFVHTSRLALSGSQDQKVDYQIHSGPAIGAFNHWVHGTKLEHWRNRHVDEIADKLMRDTADLLSERFDKMANLSNNSGEQRGKKSA